MKVYFSSNGCCFHLRRHVSKTNSSILSSSFILILSLSPSSSFLVTVLDFFDSHAPLDVLRLLLAFWTLCKATCDLCAAAHLSTDSPWNLHQVYVHRPGDHRNSISVFTMSWKLAELRWRQDVGLQESFFDRNNKTIQSQSHKPPKDSGRECNTGRSRSHTAPWSRNAHQDNPQAYISQISSVLSPLLSADKIRPDPNVSAFSPTNSICSTTPLLELAPYVPNAGVEGTSVTDNNKLPEGSRYSSHDLQTPIRASSRPASPSASRRIRLHRRGSSFSQGRSISVHIVLQVLTYISL